MNLKPKSNWTGFNIRGVIVAVVVTFALLASAASASTASSKACTTGIGTRVTVKAICKGLAFYKGKQILVIVGSAGSGNDVGMLAIAPLIDQYLGAEINVLPQGQANGIPGQDALAAATPNGLEIGFVNVGSIATLILTKQSDFNFNPGRLSWILGEITSPSVVVASPASAYSSFGSLRSVAGSSTIKVLGEFPSQGASGLEVLFNMLGIHVDWITGYASTSAVASGFFRGDGPVAVDTFSNVEGLIQGKSAIPLATSIPVLAGMPLRGLLVNAPSYESLLKTYAPKKTTSAWRTAAIAESDLVRLGQPLVTQTKVAGYKLDTLRAAFKWAWAQPSFVSAYLAAGSNPTYINPVTAKAEFNTVLKSGTALTKYLPETTP